MTDNQMNAQCPMPNAQRMTNVQAPMAEDERGSVGHRDSHWAGFAAFGVHPSGCQTRPHTLKRGHQTRMESQNVNCCVLDRSLGIFWIGRNSPNAPNEPRWAFCNASTIPRFNDLTHPICPPHFPLPSAPHSPIPFPCHKQRTDQIHVTTFGRENRDCFRRR